MTGGLLGYIEMPTYRVSMDAGDGSDEGEGESLDFRDDEAAARDAQVAKIEAAKDTIAGRDTAHIGVEVKDAEGKPVYRAVLDFRERTGEPKPARDKADEMLVGPRD